MMELVGKFLALHVADLAVAREWEFLIQRYFVPLMAYPRDMVTPLIIEEWFRNIGQHSQAQANKCLAIARLMFNRGIAWRLCAANPAREVTPYRRRERERFVQEDEMPRLLAALTREDEDVQCFILLCLLVGCRKMEAASLQWRALTADGIWVKSKTKTNTTHRVPIPKVLFDRIVKLPRRQLRHPVTGQLMENPFVFASPRGHWSRSLCHQRWDAVRKAAGLHDVTIHDLRRTCASWLAMNGENLVVISKGVLNHTTLQNTGIYTRLNVSPIARALEANSQRMLKEA